MARGYKYMKIPDGRMILSGSEDTEQMELIRWTELIGTRIPQLNMLFHVPNGGKRNALEAARFKKMGVRSGVPDLFLPVAAGGFHGFFIELKVGNNKPTENQLRWMQLLREQGYKTEVCYCARDAEKALTDYLGIGGQI